MWRIILAFAAALPCLARAELLPDPGFGNAGTVEVTLPALYSGGTPRAFVLPDRRTVIATLRANPRPFFQKQPLLSLTRLLPDGSVDPTFANGVPLELTSSSVDSAGLGEMYVRPDGSLFGFARLGWMSGTPGATLIFSVTADGHFDPAFNGGAPLTIVEAVYGRTRIFDTGSGYLITGFSRLATGNVLVGSVWRLRPDGTPDPAFGNGGVLDFPGNAGDIGGSDAMMLPGGGFQILNYEQSKPVPNYWRRYRADGSIDTAFGNGGEEAISDVDDRDDIIRSVYPLGDGTHAALGGASCVTRTLDAQGRTLAKFNGPCIGGATTNPNVQPYGGKILASAEERFGGVPPPSDGTYLWVLDRNGAVDRTFAEPQGDRWRPTTNPNWSYAVAADGDRGVVLAANGESTLTVRRYTDVRRGEASYRPIPALGVPALLLVGAGLAVFARRRLATRR
jgi:hypothetical protein